MQNRFDQIRTALAEVPHVGRREVASAALDSLVQEHAEFEKLATELRVAVEGLRAMQWEGIKRIDDHWVPSCPACEEQRKDGHSKDCYIHAIVSAYDSKYRRNTFLRLPATHAPAGCYCQPGRCMAPVIMGFQTPCRDPKKARGEV